jgi:hypothetical protein
MKKQFLWLSLTIHTVLGVTSLWAQNQVRCPIVFALYDVADMNALKVVADTLETRGKKVCFFALGQANVQLKDDPRVVFHDVGAGGADAWPRDKLLSQDTLKHLQDALQPKVIVTGMASAAQNQLLAFAPDNAFAFYDNFDPIKGKEYVQAFLSQSQSSGVKPTAYWVASEKTAKSFHEEARTCDVPVKVVGQPVLEEWATLFKETDRAAFKQALGIEEDRRVILFAGGYDESYEAYFRLFLETVVPLIEELKLEVLITYHPKPKGALEKKLVGALHNPHVRVIDSPPAGIATNKLATLASVFMCHKSSLGPQAISQGLPMIYVADPETYKNFVIEEKLAYISNDKKMLSRLIKELLQQDNPVSLKPLGMPEKPASQLMTQKIISALKS